MVRDWVDDIILVSEKDIADAMCYLLHTHHLVVEGSGAVGVAALIGEKNFETGNRIAVVLSGGNADVGMLVNMAAEYQPSP
jgi:threonine dehydratase